MFERWMAKFSQDIAVDLGTSHTRVAVKDRGIVIHEPSLVTINTRSQAIVAVGTSARDMLGKTPAHLQVIRPMLKGVISDFEITEKMLRYFIDRVHADVPTPLPRPRMVMTVPLETTEVERKAVEDAALSAGARKVTLVESPIAAAIGAGLPVMESVGSMIVDIGGGMTQIAVVSLGGVVTSRTLSVAGEEMTRNITQYVRDVYSLLIGEKVAEEVKWRLGSTMDTGTPYEMEVRGRHLVTGLPKQIILKEAEVREALQRNVAVILSSIKATLEVTPAELVADIYEHGVVLVGGSSLLRGIEKTIARETAIPVRVIDDPMTVNVRGAAALLGDDALLKGIALPSTQDAFFSS